MAQNVVCNFDSEEADAYYSFVDRFRERFASGAVYRDVPALPPVQTPPELVSVQYMVDDQILQTWNTRHNVYLVAYEDENEECWEFKHDGPRFVEGSNMLEFECDYGEMGGLHSGLQVGRATLSSAVSTLLKTTTDVEDKKESLRALCVCGPEAGRYEPVRTLIDQGFRNYRNAELTVEHVELIKKWSHLCKLLGNDGAFPIGKREVVYKNAKIETRDHLVAKLRLCLHQQA